MRPWGRRAIILVCAAILGLAAGWVWWVARLTPDAREPALEFSAGVVSLVGLLITVIPLLWSAGSQVGRGVRPIEELTGLLATAVRQQWEAVASERQLLAPAPIPIRWSLADAVVTGPLAAAIGEDGLRRAFAPLPGLAVVAEADLRAGGGQEALHALYGGLASGRLIIIGAPGAGKTAAAVLLVLRALEHRRDVSASEQGRVPVPVIFTLHGWDASTRSLQDWLADRLAETYAFLIHRSGRAEAEALIADGRVALILDGLDEVREDQRPVVLEALSAAALRLVLLTRTDEMLSTARTRRLVDAVAVQLDDVAGPVAADYLERAVAGTIPAVGWDRLLGHLRQAPGGPLAQGLSTPLALTVLRDTFGIGDDVGEVVDLAEASHGRDVVEDHLLARLVDVAYRHRAGQTPPRYSAKQAHRALAFIAAQMNADRVRDLEWWWVQWWAPATPRAIASGLVVGLFAGSLFGLWTGPASGLSAGLVVGPVVALLVRVRAGLPLGCVVGLLAATVVYLLVGSLPGLALSLVVGVIVLAVVAWGSQLVSALIFMDTRLATGGFFVPRPAGVDDGASIAPRTSWRNNQVHGLLTGLALGLIAGWVTGLLTWWQAGSAAGVRVGLIAGALAGLVSGVIMQQTWKASLAFVQLSLTVGLPVRLMRFLEDARHRGVLRTVGPYYQFRHARLQDRLATSRTE